MGTVLGHVNLTKLDGESDLKSLQFLMERELQEIKGFLESILGVMDGPYSTDCEVTIGHHAVVEPTEDMTVKLQSLSSGTLGHVTISNNTDLAHVVTIVPASDSQTIDGATSLTLAARRQAILVATNNQTWVNIGV